MCVAVPAFYSETVKGGRVLSPADPQIFHITHVENIVGILREGGLWCDSQRIARSLVTTNIGHLHIKERRLKRAVTVAAKGVLGDYVPFNFCSRSVMLYVVHCGHQDFEGGQEGIVHLVSRTSQVVALKRPWAFTDRHAELAYARYFDDLQDLHEVRWDVMNQHYWRDVAEVRQAEFLVHEFFPWTAVREVAVRSSPTQRRLQQILEDADHRPSIALRPQWYY